jgi:ABC-type microcin C transport system permease subunit YejE
MFSADARLSSGKRLRILFAMMILTVMPGCLGMVVGAAVGVTIEVVKVPFKVAGAVVDIVSDNEDDK